MRMAKARIRWEAYRRAMIACKNNSWVSMHSISSPSSFVLYVTSGNSHSSSSRLPRADPRFKVSGLLFVSERCAVEADGDRAGDLNSFRF